MTDIAAQEREAQLRKMEREAMEKVSMTNVAGKPSRTERHPSPAIPQWETATPGCVDENY